LVIKKWGVPIKIKQSQPAVLSGGQHFAIGGGEKIAVQAANRAILPQAKNHTITATPANTS
jgi:hypothetical protein